MKTDWLAEAHDYADPRPYSPKMTRNYEIVRGLIAEVESLRVTIEAIRTTARITVKMPGDGDYYVGREAEASSVLDIIEEHERESVGDAP